MVGRKLLLTSIGILVCGALALLPAAAGGAIVASANGGYQWTIEEDDVFGVKVVNRSLTVNARRHEDGSVAGVFQYHQLFLENFFHVTLSVTCFEVYDGNRAKVGGVIEVSNDPRLPPGAFGWFQAIDNGQGAGADPDQSTLVGFGSEEENESFCNSPAGPNFGPWDVTGNLQVSG